MKSISLLRTVRMGLLLIGWAVVLLGVLGFLPIILIIRSLPDFHVPFAPDSVVVDSEGRFCSSSGAYGRIQVYEADGTFRKGRFLPENSITVRLFVDKRNRIHAVHYSRGEGRDLHYVYNWDGVLLREDDWAPGTFLRWNQDAIAGQPQRRDQHGNYYSVKGLAVVKRAPGGNEQVLVSPPFYLWWMASPSLGWIHAACGMLFTALVSMLFPGPTQLALLRRISGGVAVGAGESTAVDEGGRTASATLDVRCVPSGVTILINEVTGFRRVELFGGSLLKGLVLAPLLLFVFVVLLRDAWTYVRDPSVSPLMLLFLVPFCIVPGGMTYIVLSRNFVLRAVDMREGVLALCRRVWPFPESRREVRASEVLDVAADSKSLVFKLASGECRFGSGMPAEKLAWLARLLKSWLNEKQPCAQ